MNLRDLIELVYLIRLGDEIEFYVENKQYFVQPNYEFKKEHFKELQNNPKRFQYLLYEVDSDEHSTKIFSGPLDEILQYKFYKGYTLKDDFERFEIGYIL